MTTCLMNFNRIGNELDIMRRMSDTTKVVFMPRNSLVILHDEANHCVLEPFGGTGVNVNDGANVCIRQYGRREILRD